MPMNETNDPRAVYYRNDPILSLHYGGMDHCTIDAVLKLPDGTAREHITKHWRGQWNERRSDGL